MAQSRTPGLIAPLGGLVMAKATKSSSGGSNKINQDLKINDFAKHSGGALPENIDSLDSRVQNYYQGASTVQQAEAAFNLKGQATLMGKYGGNSIDFWNGEYETIHSGLMEVVKAKAAVKQYHEQAENEMVALKASDLYAMEPDTELWNSNGDPLTAEHVFRMYGDREGAARFLEAGHDPGKQLTREGRIALQEKFLPVGTSWDDSETVDVDGYYNAMDTWMAKMGNAEQGKDGQLYLQDISKDDVLKSLSGWHGEVAPNDPELNRVRNVMLNKLSRDHLNMVLGSGAGSVEEFNSTFNNIDQIRNTFKINEYGNFTNETQRKQIRDLVAESNDPRRDEWLATLDDGVGVTNSLLYKDFTEKGMLSPGNKKALFGEQLAQKDKDYVISTLNLEEKPFEYAADIALRNAAEANDWRGFSAMADYTQAVTGEAAKRADDFINGTLTSDRINNDSSLDRASKYIQLNKGKKNLDKTFWDDDHANNRMVSSLIMHESNSEIFSGYTAHLLAGNTHNGKQYQGDATGYYYDGVDYGVNRDDFDTNMGDTPKKYRGGLRLQISTKYGGLKMEEEWRHVIKTDDFKNWLKTQSKEAQDKFWSVDQYMHVATSPGAGDDMGTSIMRKAEGGQLPLVRRDLVGILGDDTPYAGRHQQGRDVQYWDPSLGEKGNNRQMDTDFFILEEISMVEGMRPVVRDAQGKKIDVPAGTDIHVESRVALNKDDLKKYKWKDVEGGKRLYHESFGEIDKISMFDLGATDPIVKKWLKETAVTGLSKSGLFSKDVQEIAKSTFVIPFYLKRDGKAYAASAADKRQIKRQVQSSGSENRLEDQPSRDNTSQGITSR